MTFVCETKAHRVGDDEWNRVYEALGPFVSGLTQEIARRKHVRMTDAVIKALRANPDKNSERAE